MALKEKEGKQSHVSELKPWPSYIEVRIFNHIFMIIHYILLILIDDTPLIFSH